MAEFCQQSESITEGNDTRRHWTDGIQIRSSGAVAGIAVSECIYSVSRKEQKERRKIGRY
jgi:hypothetical protein